MANNFYDSEVLFKNYQELRQSSYCGNDVIEKSSFKKMLPCTSGKKILDLGCGAGKYDIEFFKDAKLVDAVDISENMLSLFREELKKESLRHINVIRSPLEKFNFKEDYYDLIFSSNAFHYVEDLDALFSSIYKALRRKGVFIFSVEHPVYTATKQENRGWELDEGSNYTYWKLDNYFETGIRRTEWLGEWVIKYHRTFQNYFELLNKNFSFHYIVEPCPTNEQRKIHYKVDSYYRRPTFLIFMVEKKWDLLISE